MSDIIIKDVAVGKVLGYTKNWNILSHESYAIVTVNKKKIIVSIDSRQQKFVQKEFPIGSNVPVGYYGGKWHIASKPISEIKIEFDTSVPYMDVLESVKASNPAIL